MSERVILRGGRVIDPCSKRDEIADVVIAGEKVEKIGKLNGAAEEGIVDCRGAIVIPGMIDMHTHCFYRGTDLGIHPDIIGVNSGAVAVGDGGSTGAANIRSFRDLLFNKCETRVFAFINAGVEGIVNADTTLEASTAQSFDIDWTLSCIEENPDFIKGVKLRMARPVIGSLGLNALRIAKRIAATAKLPLAMHIGGGQPQPEWPAAVELLSKGDLIEHCHTGNLGNVLDDSGKVYPEVKEAIDRGVLMDVAHGIARCWSWRVAEQCLEQGLPVHVISTDVHIKTGPGFDLPTVMSKYLCLGIELPELVSKVTVNPARVLGLKDGSGELKAGGPADITVLDMLDGDFELSDVCGVTRVVHRLLKHRFTVRRGKVFENKPYFAKY